MELWLNSVGEWTLFLILLGALQGAAAVGYRLALRHADSRSRADGKSEVSSIQGAVLGLLALLLGFTFAMAAQRFEDRKLLIRDEANGIGTLGLRIDLIPKERRVHVRELLLRYTDTCIALQLEGFDPARLREHHMHASQLQNQLWAEAMAVAAVVPDSETMSLFISALNEVIDLHGMQLAAIRNRIPSAIFLLLFAVSVVALGLVGYGSSLPHRQRFALTFLLSLLFSCVMILTVDLHRPTRGLVTVSLTSLQEARDSLPPAATR